MPPVRNQILFLDDVLILVRNRLADASIFGDESSFVYVSLDENQGQPPKTDQYLVLVPGPQRPEQAIVGGAAARTITAMTGSVGVILWSRLATDVQQQDDDFLTNKSLGALAALRRVYVTLQLWDPTDDLGAVYLFAEPCRIADAGSDFRPKPRPQPGWGSVVTILEIKYLADLVSP